MHVDSVDDFDKAIKAARPGDLIVLNNGQWRDVELLADARGTARWPIRVEAQQPGKVTISRYLSRSLSRH